MKLIALEKVIHSIQENDWILNNISFNDKINFIVGKNSTGKSRIINQLYFLHNMLNSSTIMGYANRTIEHWKLEFSDKGDIYKYEFYIDKEGEIQKEELKVNNKEVLFRFKEEARLYSSIKKEFIEVEGDYTLIAQIRRDSKEFPYIYKLQKWARGFVVFKFVELKATNKNQDTLSRNWLHNFNYDIVEILKKRGDTSFKDGIIEDLNILGFEVSNLFLEKRGDFDFIYIEEKGLAKPISIFQISEGLYRSLALLILVNALLSNPEVTTIAIDDLGEGLDYDRATKLGKLLVEKIENSNIQLIATSNDSFLMDVVPIKYWNILQREGNTVRSLNYQNSKELFDKFKLTGLSNFDLFSSDYLLQKQ